MLVVALAVAGSALLAMPALAAKLPGQSLSIGDATISVTFEDGPLNLAPASVFGWINESACAVATYYGRFPVHHLRLSIVPIEERRGVLHGRTDADGGAEIMVSIGQYATESDLRDDWILTHEMVHLAFPSVPRQHHWIEEGIATYVEPIARAQIGDLRPEKIWGDLVDGLPKGTPDSGDEGLDNTHTWGRTYWGGALYCTLADVDIRRRTHNRFGLQDALRGIVDAGGSIEADWPLTRALKVADDAVGVPAMMELYNRMKDAPMDPDLAKLWRELGVTDRGGLVTFESDAPLAAVRSAITVLPKRAKVFCRGHFADSKAPAPSR
ncbi:MAG: hypothetical protein ACLQAT_21135 [Candidatus Binataceae bacterium]